MDISTSLVAVRENLLANNPYEPPPNDKCPIYELPAEILRHIFEIGVEMQEEGDEGEKGEVEGEKREEEDKDKDKEDFDDDFDVYDGVDCLMTGSLLSSGSQASIFSAADDFDGYDGVDRLMTGSLLSSGSSIGTADDEGPLGDKNPLDDSNSETPLFQILVSHVCRYWREVALNSYTLWTSLDLDRDNIIQLERSKVFIERAHGLPLKIYIYCTLKCDQVKGYYSQLENELTLQILDLIEPEVSHWKELDFHVSTYGDVRSLLSRLQKIPNAPLLRKFHVHYYGDYVNLRSINGETSYVPFHGNAPLLESAIFWGVYIDWDKSLRFLQNLREFELSFHSQNVRPSYTTFTQIIKNSPQLRSLSLYFSGPSLHNSGPFHEEGQWGPEPFEIPSLHHLTLRYYEDRFTTAFIQHFYFPNLRSLTLDFKGYYTSLVNYLVVPVKGRSTSILAGLENLKMSEISWPWHMSTIEAMLIQLANLKVLELNCFDSENVIFRKLIDPMAGRKKTRTQINAVAQTLPKIFCPLLETFTVKAVNEFQLKGLVIAREKAGAPLKTLRLRHEDCVSTKLREWLKNHVEVVEFFNGSDSDDDDSDEPDVDSDDSNYDSDDSNDDSYESDDEEEEE